MHAQIKGISGSFFHNNLLIGNKLDKDSGRVLIKHSNAGDDIVCSLNGYAIIPIDDYYALKGQEMPVEMDEKIKEINLKLVEIER